MCVCVHLCMCVLCVHVCVCVSACMYMYVCVRVCIVCLRMCVFVCACVYACVCVSFCVYICLCVCIACVCAYVFLDLKPWVQYAYLRLNKNQIHNIQLTKAVVFVAFLGDLRRLCFGTDTQISLEFNSTLARIM